MPDWFSDNAPKSTTTAAAGGDWFDLYSPSRKPVSAEDFTPPQPSKGWPPKLSDVAWPTVKGLAKSIIGGGIDTAKAISDLQRGTMGGDMEALDRTTQRVKGIGAASADQFRKAVAAPTTSEFVGHALSSIPVVGPPIGQAGEKIAAGDWEGLGEGIGLVAAPFAPKVLPAVGRGAAAVGRGAQSAGRAVGPVASMALEAAPQIVADTAFSYMAGHPLPPVMTAAKLAQSVVGKVKEGRAIKAAAAVADAEATAKAATDAARIAKLRETTQLIDTPEAFAKRGGEHKTVPAPTRASGEQILSDVLDELGRANSASRVELPPPPGLPPGYQPRATVPRVRVSAANEAAQAPPPARVTTPPPAGLPPGYTPRTTAPKPKAAPKATRKRPASPEMGPNGYFLRKPEPVAAMEPVEAVPMTEASLPTSWRGRTNQPLVSPNSATGKQWAAQFADELQARGLSAEDAIVLVSKNPDLPPMVRLQIVSALKQVK